MSSYDLVVLGDVDPDLVLRRGNVTPAFGQADHLADHLADHPVDDASASRLQGSTS